jgi:hypothetical protein
MIPRWQMVGCVLLALLALATGIYADDGSYWHAFLWGQCRTAPMPAACHPPGGSGGFGRGLGHMP